MQLILPGRVPSKKNSKQIICKGSRPVLLSSERYQAWEEEQLWRLKTVKERFTGRVSVHCTFYPPDKVKGDCSNKFESVADLLVKAGIIEDDDWFHLVKQSSEFGGVDKDNPRVEVHIDELP